MNIHYRDRLASESGFTLIELLVVVQILAILTLIAVPQFIGVSAKARVAATESNVRSAIPAAMFYYQDTVNNPTPNTFAGISGAKLRLEARGISPNAKAGAKTVSTANDAFCIQDSEDGGKTIYHYEGGVGGAATVLVAACPAAYAVT
jgi:prepilin-type N-terminal cleavage/methylation domain-containing protein